MLKRFPQRLVENHQSGSLNELAGDHAAPSGEDSDGSLGKNVVTVQKLQCHKWSANRRIRVKENPSS